MDPPTFGSAPFFGQPSQDYMTNVTYMQNAQQFAALNPMNVAAQRQAAYWQEVVNRHAQALGAGQASAPMQNGVQGEEATVQLKASR